MAAIGLRRMREEEVESVVRLWGVTKRDAYPYLPTEQAYTVDDDRRFFKSHIAPRCEIWLAHRGDELAGFLALDGSYLDRLYIHPEYQRAGIGTALLAKARELAPGGIELHTHQQNTQARAFYEKHGFRAVRFGVSPPPESAPDVEYHWRPGDD